MVVEEYNIYDPFQYPWMGINFFLAFWFVSNACRFSLHWIKYSNMALTFSELEEYKKRNVVTYILQFWVTLAAFVLQIYGGADVLFRLEDTTTPNRNNCMILALLLVSVLYTWELCYRQMIGFPLLLHHIVTFVLIQCSTASYFDTQSVLYIRYAMLLGFHATTEQISFLALFCFRLSLFPKYESTLFYLATVQAFVLKTLVTVAALVFFALNTINDEFNDESNHWDVFWLVSFVPLLLLLYAAQVYACGILYSLAKRCKKSYETMTKVVEVAENRSISVRQRKRRVLEGLRSLTQERIHESMRMLDTFENNSLHDGGLGFSTHGHHDLSRRSFHHQYGDGRLPPPPSGHLTVSEELSARRDSLMESAFSFHPRRSSFSKQHELEEHHHDSRDHHQDHDSRRRSEILREAVMTCMRTTSSSAFFGPWDEELVRLDEEEEQDDEEQQDEDDDEDAARSTTTKNEVIPRSNDDEEGGSAS